MAFRMEVPLCYNKLRYVSETGQQVAALKRLLDTSPGEDDLKNMSLFLEANA